MCKVISFMFDGFCSSKWIKALSYICKADSVSFVSINSFPFFDPLNIENSFMFKLNPAAMFIFKYSNEFVSSIKISSKPAELALGLINLINIALDSIVSFQLLFPVFSSNSSKVPSNIFKAKSFVFKSLGSVISMISFFLTKGVFFHTRRLSTAI